MAKHGSLIAGLARVASVEHVTDIPEGAIQLVVDEATIAIPLAGVIDLDAERQRLEKAIAKADGEIAKLAGKLGNEKFVANAPEAVVAENRARLADEEAQRDKLKEALERIAAAG